MGIQHEIAVHKQIGDENKNSDFNKMDSNTVVAIFSVCLVFITQSSHGLDSKTEADIENFKKFLLDKDVDNSLQNIVSTVDTTLLDKEASSILDVVIKQSADLASNEETLANILAPAFLTLAQSFNNPHVKTFVENTASIFHRMLEEPQSRQLILVTMEKAGNLFNDQELMQNINTGFNIVASLIQDDTVKSLVSKLINFALENIKLSNVQKMHTVITALDNLLLDSNEDLRKTMVQAMSAQNRISKRRRPFTSRITITE